MLEQSQEQASIRQDRADLYDKLRYDLAVRMEETIRYSVSELRMLKQQLEQGQDKLCQRQNELCQRQDEMCKQHGEICQQQCEICKQQNEIYKQHSETWGLIVDIKRQQSHLQDKQDQICAKQDLLLL